MSTLSPDSTTLDYTAAGPAAGDDPLIGGVRRSAWVKVAIVGGLFVAIFWPNLRRLFDKINPISGDPNWQHGLLVPLVGLYYLYINREQLLKDPAKPTWLGLGVLLFGLLFSMYGIFPGQNDYLWDAGMIVTLFGLVLLLGGWGVMRTAWFPILFLFCALPWPALVYSAVASPLQELAAAVAVKALQFTGVEAAGRTGTKIFYVGQDRQFRALNVAEACAGMRSLMTFISVAAAVAFLSARPLWQRVVITASAVPIAVFCNVLRVAGQGLIDYYWSQQFAEGFAHTFVGLIMLIPAFFLILLVAWIIDHVFIDEADEEEKARLAKAARAKLVVTPRTSAAAAAPGGTVVKIARPAGAASAGAAATPVRRPAVRTVTRRIAPAKQPPTAGGGGPSSHSPKPEGA